MRHRPTSAIEALSFLLQEWVEGTFNAMDCPVSELNLFLWRPLAQALGEVQTDADISFQKEISPAGSPPVQALEQRLRELVAVGMRELFLVIAIRQGLDQLIGLHFPAYATAWQERADAILPVQIQFGKTDADLHASTTTYGPGARVP